MIVKKTFKNGISIFEELNDTHPQQKILKSNLVYEISESARSKGLSENQLMKLYDIDEEAAYDLVNCYCSVSLPINKLKIILTDIRNINVFKMSAGL